MWEIFNPIDGKPQFVTDSERIARIWCQLFPKFDYELAGKGWVAFCWEKVSPN